MTLLRTGDVIELPVGLKVYHNQGKEVLEIKTPALVVVETTRLVAPINITGAEAHFEECYMVKARALNQDGTYHHEGALLTFAQYGDFKPEYILPEQTNQVLRRMKRIFEPIA